MKVLITTNFICNIINLKNFLKYDEEIWKIEEKLKQQADKFGFENKEFISQHLSELENKIRNS